MPISLRALCARWLKPRAVLGGPLVVSLFALGCGHFGGAQPDEIEFRGDPKPTRYYRDKETSVAHSNFRQPTPDDVKFASRPRTIADRTDDAIRDVTLAEIIQVALSNNKIVQTSTQGVGAKSVFQNPDNVASVYDQAINESGVLFGRRGVEAALSEFDATLRSTMTWGRSSSPQNSLATLGATSTAETGNFTSSMSKQFATGASLSFFHNWNYLGSNNPGVLFPSSYTGNLGLAFRQPLLAGAGTEFTRIAGPVNPNFGAITGVSQGVLIARINSDISLANFEASVRNSIRDIQHAYWDLYLAYRNYDTAVVSHRSAHQTWKEAKIKLDVGTLKAADEAQALEQFYGTQAAVESNLNNLYKAETSLRRLIGIQLNDGEILRPADDPSTAPFAPDWRTSLAEGLCRRVELRRQKWNIKSLQLQLKAASNLTRPRFDFVSGYTLNGFGDDLLTESDNDPVSGRNLGSAYGTLTQGDYPEWNLGFEFSVPLGFRSAKAQVRNFELRLSKARAVLAQQEREVAHDVTTAIQDIIANYQSAETNKERLIAARRRVELLELERIEGTTTLDLVLRAQVALAQAESQYYSRIVDLNKAIVSYEFAKGTLLPGSGIQLAEGNWDACAYQDAMRRACERTYAFDSDKLCESTAPFASEHNLSPVEVAPMPRDLAHEPAGAPPATPEAPVSSDGGAGDAGDRAAEVINPAPAETAPAAPVEERLPDNPAAVPVRPVSHSKSAPPEAEIVQELGDPDADPFE